MEHESRDNRIVTLEMDPAPHVSGSADILGHRRSLRRVRRAAAGAFPMTSLGGFSGGFHSCLRGYFRLFGDRKLTIRGLRTSSQVSSYLIGESDNFRSQSRLWWWSFGAFDETGQLEGSQYLAGRRAPPLSLHQ